MHNYFSVCANGSDTKVVFCWQPFAVFGAPVSVWFCAGVSFHRVLDALLFSIDLISCGGSWKPPCVVCLSAWWQMVFRRHRSCKWWVLQLCARLPCQRWWQPVVQQSRQQPGCFQADWTSFQCAACGPHRMRRESGCLSTCGLCARIWRFLKVLKAVLRIFLI